MGTKKHEGLLQMKPTKETDIQFVNRNGKRWFEQEDTDELRQAVARLWFGGYE